MVQLPYLAGRLAVTGTICNHLQQQPSDKDPKSWRGLRTGVQLSGKGINYAAQLLES